MNDRQPIRAAPESDSHDDLIGRLIRIADGGPELPADGAIRIKAAVEPTWRQEVRRRTRRRVLTWTASGLAAAAAVLVAFALATRTGPGTTPPPVTLATIAAIEGAPEVLPPQPSPANPRTPEIGAAIAAGSWLRTAGHDRVALSMAGGRSLRLDHGTAVRLESPISIYLERGAAYLSSGPLGDASVEVRTPMGVARELGTQYEVRLAPDALRLRVREGAVLLMTPSSQQEVRQGTALILGPDGAVRRASAATWGPEWQWVQDVAPPFDVEGRRVTEFLAWVARETGLEVRYASESTRKLASSTMLHGTILDLAPADAPGVVLPGCGLDHRVVDGTMIVEEPSDERREP